MLRTCLAIETLFNNLSRENLFETFQSFRSLKFSSMNPEFLDKIIDIIMKKACEKPEIVAFFGIYYIYLTDSTGDERNCENRKFVMDFVRYRFNGFREIYGMTNELQENIDSIFEFITHLYLKNRYFGGSVVTRTVSLPVNTRKPKHVKKPKKRTQSETVPPANIDFEKSNSSFNSNRVPLEVLKNNSKIENLRKTIGILAVENVKKLKIIKKLRKVIEEQNAEIQELKKEKMCEEVERIHRKYERILRIEDFQGFIEKINEYLSVLVQLHPNSKEILEMKLEILEFKEIENEGYLRKIEEEFWKIERNPFISKSELEPEIEQFPSDEFMEKYQRFVDEIVL